MNYDLKTWYTVHDRMKDDVAQVFSCYLKVMAFRNYLFAGRNYFYELSFFFFLPQTAYAATIRSKDPHPRTPL